MPAPRHDWYAKEWLAHLDKRQADVERDLGWNKSTVSLMVRGSQPYTRDYVNELAAYLNIAPFELLMHPDDAAGLRKLRAAGLQVVEGGKAFDRASERAAGTGTEG